MTESSKGLRRIQDTLRPWMSSIQNMGWISFGHGIQTLFTVLVGAWVARYLGPHDYGVLSLAASVVTIGMVAANLGMEMVVKKRVLEAPDQKHTLLGTAYVLKLCAAFMVTCLFALGVGWDGFSGLDRVILLSCGMYLFDTARVVDFWFQSQLQARFSTLILSGSLMVTGAVKIWLILQGAGVELFAATLIFYGIIGHIGYLFLYQRKNGDLFQWSFSSKTARHLLGLSWPLIFNSVNAMLYTRVDQVMLASMSSLEEVGIYNAAGRILEMTMILPVAICSSLFPKLVSSAKHAAPKQHRTNILRFFRFISLVGYGVVVALFLFGPWGMTVLFGEEYAASGQVLRILCFGLLFKFLIVARGQVLVSENLMKLSLISSTLGLGMNVVANWFLIPVYGMYGAAAATLLSLFTTLFFVFIPRSGHSWIGRLLFASLLKPFPKL